MLVKKNKTLKSEIENHEPRINFVRNNGQKLIDENNAQSEEFERQIADLQEKLAHLKENLEARNVKLLMSEKVQQFFFDANEAEAWMSEQGNYKIDNYMIIIGTGKSLSEVLLFAEHGANMLCTKIVLNVRNNFCTQHVLPRFELGIFMY